MATLKDVAKLAGVSTATASSVLSGRRKVSSHLAERVNRAVAALDYRPNVVARSLRDQRTMTIGVSVPDITNPFFNGIVASVDAAAAAAGYQVLLVSNDERTDVEQARIETLVARQVDGLIVIPTDDAGAYTSSLRHRQVPVVFVDRGSASLPFDLVGVDNAQAAFEATRYLISLGHRRIAALATSSALQNIRQRLDGYRRALFESGLTADERLVGTAGFDLGDGIGVARSLLEADPAPTAVFSFTNRMALSALRAIRELGLDVPTDISLLTFDEVDWATAMVPALTTVAQPLAELGHEAFSVLKSRMEGDKGPQQKIALECRLMIRASTAPRSNAVATPAGFKVPGGPPTR